MTKQMEKMNEKYRNCVAINFNLLGGLEAVRNGKTRQQKWHRKQALRQKLFETVAAYYTLTVDEMNELRDYVWQFVEYQLLYH